MILNYLKLAIRNMLRGKNSAIINILGLSISVAVSLLIFQYVSYELSFDKFHAQVSTLFRVNLTMQQGEQPTWSMATNHPAVGPALKQDFPEIEQITRVLPASVLIGSSVLSYKPAGQKIKSFFQENMYLADSSFFDVFSFQLVKGDPETALAVRNSVVITEQVAEQYFGTEDPMGKTLSVQGRFPVQVTGVLRDLPKNSHLRISALFPMALMGPAINSEWKWPEWYTYVRLHPNARKEAMESKFDDFANKYLGDIMEEYGLTEEFHLQPIVDIHLHGVGTREVDGQGNAELINSLALLAILILIVAWINYLNLATARANERAFEVGMRKVVGAGKRQLVTQFLVEAALTNLIALTAGLGIFILAVPSFNALFAVKVESNLWNFNILWAISIAIFLIGTFLVGLYPAMILSSFNTSSTLKGKHFVSRKESLLRQLMTVFQFAVSLMMIALTILVFRQLSYMKNQSLGFDPEQILVMRSPKVYQSDSIYLVKLEYFNQKAANHPAIISFTPSNEIPGHKMTSANSIKQATQLADESILANHLYIDDQFLQTFGLQLTAGRNFSEELASDDEAALLNEKAVGLLGFASADEALNQIIDYRFRTGWEKARVIGVVNDFNHRSLTHERSPFLFLRKDIRHQYFSFKINTEDWSELITMIEADFEEVFPGNPVDYFFLDDYFNRAYEADQRFGRLLGLFSALAIFVTCLGLQGLAAFIATRRLKEIGIRKVLGAEPLQILMLLSKQFAILLMAAVIVSVPIAWKLGNEWLSSYSYRIEIGAWLFGLALLLIVGITAATIIWQTRRAAYSNPVEVIGYE